MDKTLVDITLSFVEIKSVCEAVSKWPVGQPGYDAGEVRMANHILGIIERVFGEEG